MTRPDLLRVYLRPGGQILAEIETMVLPGISGADPRRLAVAVCDGIVTISGRIEYRSAALRLVEAARRAEGVIHIDNQLSYDIDDRYPALPAGF